jgi:uncharacterized protein
MDLTRRTLLKSASLGPAWLAAVNLPSMAGAKSTREHRWPMPVALADVRMTGELARRLAASFDRLEEEWYRPPLLYDSPNDGWPGDKEGRTLLGLVLLSQVTGRTARHLEDSLNLYPQKVNARGYLGPIIVPDVIPEQTLGGQFWLVRAFYEYEAWKNDKRASAWANQVLRNVYVSAAGSYRHYPINPSERKSQDFVFGSAIGQSGKWILSSDVGCGLAGGLDALTEAYARHPSEETGRVLEEVIQRFLQMDLEAVSAQLHSTLVATRSLLRHFETTGRKELLQAAADRYKLYRERAMTDTFENHNWFRRPEWTEGCAVVDSFITAVQLWRFTGDVKYLEDAHHIYYNGLCVNQRGNGGLGCDSCLSRDKPLLTIKTQEARWCCTQRGADGLTRAAQYCFFTSEAGVVIPFYQDAEATLRWGGQSLTLREQAAYPWEGSVRMEVAAAQCDEPRTLSLFTPSWAGQPVLRLNGREQRVAGQGGFLTIQRRWRAGDVVELSFEQSVVSRPPVNRANGADRGEYHTFHYGPLILGYPGPKAVTLKPDTRFHRKGERGFAVEETDVILQPIYHLLDPAVSMDRGYQRQILFRSHE